MSFPVQSGWYRVMRPALAAEAAPKDRRCATAAKPALRAAAATRTACALRAIRLARLPCAGSQTQTQAQPHLAECVNITYTL